MLRRVTRIMFCVGILAVIFAPGSLATAQQLGVPANDDCENAEVITPGTFTGTTFGASNDGNSSCGMTEESPDVWYVFRPESTCQAMADTCDSCPTPYDTVLSVHTGCPGDLSNEVACNDDDCDLQSRVTWNAVAGNEYYLRVTGFNGAEGDFTVGFSCEVCKGQLTTLPVVRAEPGTLEIGFSVWVQHNLPTTVTVPIWVTLFDADNNDVMRKPFGPYTFEPGTRVDLADTLLVGAERLPPGAYTLEASINRMHSLPSLRAVVKITE